MSHLAHCLSLLSHACMVRYGALYGISFIPVLLVIMTVLVLFYNSLK